MKGRPAAALSRSISAIDAYRQALELQIEPGERITVLPMWAIAPDTRNPSMHPVRIRWAEGRILRSAPDVLSWYGNSGRKSSTGTCAFAGIAHGAKMQVALEWSGSPMRSTLPEIKASHDAAMLELFVIIEKSLTWFVRRFDAQRLNELIDSGFIEAGQVMSSLDIEVAVSEWMVGERQKHRGGGPRWIGLVDRLVDLDYLAKIDSPYLWFTSEVRRTAHRIVATVYNEPAIAEQVRRLKSMFDSDAQNSAAPEQIDARFLSLVNSAMPNESVGLKRIRHSLEPTTTPSLVAYDELDEHQSVPIEPGVVDDRDESLFDDDLVENIDWQDDYGATIAT